MGKWDRNKNNSVSRRKLKGKKNEKILNPQVKKMLLQKEIREI